jgi:hypothetical protein
MRDLTKSFFSFSWAMTLFGLEQFRTLFSDEIEGRRRDRMTHDLEAVTDVAKRRLSKRNASMFESGNDLQRDMVDLMYDIVRGEEVKPRSVFDRAADLVEESADALRDMVGEKKDDKKKTTRTRRTRSRKKSSSKPASETA